MRKQENACALFEQPAAHNKYLDFAVPVTWQKRLDLAKLSVPLWLFNWLVLTELYAFRLWLEGESLVRNLHSFIAISLVTWGTLLAIVEIELLLRRKRNRRLRLQPKQITLDNHSIPWRWLRGARVEPIPGENSLRKVVIEYSPARNRTREWSLALKHPEETNRLGSVWTDLYRSGVTSIALEEMGTPSPATRMPSAPRGLLQLGLALWLVANGVTLLGVGTLAPTPKEDNTGPSKLTPEQAERLRSTLGTWFHSHNQSRAFLLLMGSACTASGIFFWVRASRLMRKPPVFQNDSASSSEATS